MCLSGCARHGPLARAVENRPPRRGRGGRPAPAEDLRRRTASGWSSSGRSRATTAAATACSPRWPSAWACRRWPPATCTPTSRSRALLQDALVAVRLGKTLDECEPQRRGNSSHVLASAGGDGRALRRPPRRRGTETARLAERLRLRPHLRPRLRLPGRGGSRRRPQAGRDVRTTAWPSAIPRRACARRRPRRASRRSCG